MRSFLTFIDNGFEEVDIEVHYDYQPAERATRYYPGCDEMVCINRIFRSDNRAEIFLINKRSAEIMCENIVEGLRNY